MSHGRPVDIPPCPHDNCPPIREENDMTTDTAEIHTTAAYIDGIALITADIRIEHERIDVTAEYEPDPTWIRIDTAGHFHAWSLGGTKHADRLPTLRGVQIEQPCDGEECGGVCGGEGYTRTEYHCAICGEVIEPKMRHTTGRRYEPGLMSWTVEVQLPADDARPLLGRQQVSFCTANREGRMYFGIGHLRETAFDSDGLVTATLYGIGPLGERGKP